MATDESVSVSKSLSGARGAAAPGVCGHGRHGQCGRCGKRLVLGTENHAGPKRPGERFPGCVPSSAEAVEHLGVQHTGLSQIVSDFTQDVEDVGAFSCPVQLRG